jgi:O-antigen/teichoic acid export membrane protein
MVYLDRFAISGLISIAAVSFYATPYEIITKLWIIPSAIVTVLFPAFAENHKRNPDGTLTLLIVGTKYIALILFPLVLLVATFANELLSLWLGHEFASKSTSVLQWLSIGVYLNCIAMMFFTYIQAIGRPDLSAKLHIIELPFYLLLLWWAIQYFGMLGAAIVWTIRVTLDGSVLIVLLSYQNAKFSARLKSTMKYIVISTMALCFPLVLGAFTQRLLLTTLILSIYSYLTWFELLDKEEKYFIKLKLAGLFVKRKSLAD